MYTILTLYAVLVLWIVWRAGRHESREDFLIAGRDRGLFQVTCSKFAASIGAGWFLVYTAFGYRYGAAIFYGLASYAVGYLLFAWLAVPRIWAWGSGTRALTVGDLVAERTGTRTAGHVTNAMIALTTLIGVSVSVTGGAKVLEYLDVPGGFTAAVLITSGFTLFYLLLSGFKGVVLTDVLQALVIVLFALVIGWAVARKPDLMLALAQENEPIKPTIVAGLALLGFSFLTSSDRYQLTYAARSQRAARLGMALPLVFVLAVAFVLVLVGQYAKLVYPQGEADMAFIYVLTQLLPHWIVPFGLALLMAAIMSTIDSLVFAIASHSVLHREWQSPERAMRWAMVVTVVLLAAFALLVRDMVDITLLSITAQMVGAIAMLYILAGGRSARTFFLALAGGLLGALGGLWLLGIQPLLAVTTLLGGTLLLLVGLAQGRFAAARGR